MIKKRSKQFIKDICRAVGHQYKYGHASDICNRCGYNSLAEFLKKSIKGFIGAPITTTTTSQIHYSLVKTLTGAVSTGNIDNFKNVTVRANASNPRELEVKMEVYPAGVTNTVIVSANINI